MGLLRQNVKALLDEELEPIQLHETNRFINSTKNDAEYVKQRLKAHPDLADKVARGELAANATSRQAFARREPRFGSIICEVRPGR